MIFLKKRKKQKKSQIKEVTKMNLLPESDRDVWGEDTRHGYSDQSDSAGPAHALTQHRYTYDI